MAPSLEACIASFCNDKMCTDKVALLAKKPEAAQAGHCFAHGEAQFLCMGAKSEVECREANLAHGGSLCFWRNATAPPAPPAPKCDQLRCEEAASKVAGTPVDDTATIKDLGPWGFDGPETCEETWPVQHGSVVKCLRPGDVNPNAPCDCKVEVAEALVAAKLESCEDCWTREAKGESATCVVGKTCEQSARMVCCDGPGCKETGVAPAPPSTLTDCGKHFHCVINIAPKTDGHGKAFGHCVVDPDFPIGDDCGDSQAQIWCEEKYTCACFGPEMKWGDHDCKCVDDKASVANVAGHACGAKKEDCACPKDYVARCDPSNEKTAHACYCVSGPDEVALLA